MGWASDLVKKLPTWRGIGAFIYVATNWPRINEDIEAYRHQIKDREEWAKQARAEQEHLHATVIEQMRADTAARRGRENAALETALDNTRAELAESQRIIVRVTDQYVDALLLLAQLLARESPLTRALLLNSLDEQSQKLADLVMKRLPPAPELPSLPPLGQILGPQ
jgi:hypothetical protein